MHVRLLLKISIEGLQKLKMYIACTKVCNVSGQIKNIPRTSNKKILFTIRKLGRQVR